MKKLIITVSIALALSVSSPVFSGLLVNSTTYTVTINSTGSCFAYDDCTTLTDNVQGGSFTIMTNATGDGFSVGNYAVGAYTGTPSGLITTGGPVAGSGTVGAGGELDLDFAGRTAFLQFDPFLGTVAWNIDNNTQTGSTTGLYEGFTSGTDTNLTRDGLGNTLFSLTGSHLSSNGDGTYGGVIVSVGNIGTAVGFIQGIGYTEVYNITVSAAPVSAVPVPAAAWLFGSGLLGLVGAARRKA